jgi:hypothetical protein
VWLQHQPASADSGQKLSEGGLAFKQRLDAKDAMCAKKKDNRG